MSSHLPLAYAEAAPRTRDARPASAALLARMALASRPRPPLMCAELAPDLQHVPVMVRETLDLLAPGLGSTIVDCTLGAGGHARAILEALGPHGRLIGIDQDPQAVGQVRARLPDPRLSVVQDNFVNLEAVLGRQGVPAADGFIFDLGVSADQLSAPERGFSFRLHGPLDMRFSPSAPTCAADLLARLSEQELARLFTDFGQERWARRIAKLIAQTRQHTPIITTDSLAALVMRAVPARARAARLHPATRTFMALRIAVNDELRVLHSALFTAARYLNPHGRIVVLSYHSLEDGVTKRAFRQLATQPPCPPLPPDLRLRILTPRPLRPSAAEVSANPRARSARLRAAQRPAPAQAEAVVPLGPALLDAPLP